MSEINRHLEAGASVAEAVEKTLGPGVPVIDTEAERAAFEQRRKDMLTAAAKLDEALAKL